MNVHPFRRRRFVASSSLTRRPCRPALEMLEERCVPATYFVTSSNDSGAGTLRQAIVAAAGDTSSPTIRFAPNLSGPHIGLSSELQINNAAFTAANPLTIRVDPGL